MDLTISLIGILIALAVLVILMMKGVNLFVAVMVASLIAILTSGLNIYETLKGGYLDGFTGYWKSNFFMFLMGIFLGIFMEVSGGAQSIAHWIIGKMKDKAYFAIPIAVGIIAYGGVAAIASTFPVIPVARAVFKENDIPRRLMPGALYFGACTFAMVAPGAPQVQNIIPATGFGVDLMAGLGCSLAGVISMFIIGSLWLKKMIDDAKANGEHYDERATDSDVIATNLPSPILSVLPLIITIIVINIKNAEGANLIPVEPSVGIGVLSAIILLWKYIDKQKMMDYLAKGVSNTANTVFNISTIVGFGSVVRLTSGFTYLIDLVVNLPLPYVFAVALGTAVLCGICGSASGGLGIITPIFAEVYGKMPGVDVGAISRIMSLASASLDSSPHSGAVTSIIHMCGETHKSSYIPIFNLSVITPAIGTIVGCIFFMIFGF